MTDIALMRRLRAAYYKFDWLRANHWLGRKIAAYEQGRFGDAPKPKADWDQQFKSGSWDYLASDKEFSRYSVIVGYMSQYDGDILDVGCGDGVLYHRFSGYDYNQYVGIDISEVAIARLRHLNFVDTRFIAVDAECYEPDDKFDVIVFNESLYYMREPRATLQRYAQYLTDNGVLIVSNYTASRRSMAILRDIKRAYQIINETITIQNDRSWVCMVIQPK